MAKRLSWVVLLRRIFFADLRTVKLNSRLVHSTHKVNYFHGVVRVIEDQGLLGFNFVHVIWYNYSGGDWNVIGLAPVCVCLYL